MNSLDLQKLAQHSRSTKEAGFALLFASGVLALFLLIPHTAPRATSAITVATSTIPNAFAQIPIDAKAAIVYDLVTGQTLYEKNADAQLPLASLTKLLTMYAAFATLSPDTPITIPADVANLYPPHAFSVGQVLPLKTIARLTLTASLNDGAAAIAEATAAHENHTLIATLAGAAAALNLSQTYAVNGNGLDVSTTISGGYGSARDLARLAGAFVAEAPTVAAATTKSTAEGTSLGGTVFSVKNTDPMVNTIPGLLLSKTGYTDLAGGNLVLVFDAGIKHPIAVVVLGSSLKQRFTDGMTLVAATLAHFAGVPSL